MYIVSQKNCATTFVHNFDKYWPYFKILSLSYSPSNFQQNSTLSSLFVTQQHKPEPGWLQHMGRNAAAFYQVKDVSQLKQRLIDIWHRVQQRVIDDSVDEWRKSLCAWIRVNGGHFQHLTLSVRMSAKVDIRGPVLKSTFRSRVLLPRYMSIEVDTHS